MDRPCNVLQASKPKGGILMQRILATAAILAAAAPALAQDAGDMSGENELIRARDITGGTVYSMAESGSWQADMRYDGVGDGWRDIGEIEDIVFDRNGKMIGVVAEVGGFLDIADKHVMLELASVKLVAEDNASYAVVTRRSEEELEAMDAVDEGWWE
jgi:hypothetical protein